MMLRRFICGKQTISGFSRNYQSGKIPELTKVCINIKNHKYHYVVLKNLLFLLKNRYPVKRLDFAQVTDKDVSFFEKLLSPSRVLTTRSDVEGFNIDFLRTCRGDSQVVLKPRSTKEVSEILKYCNQRKLAVVPQGKTITSISLGKLNLSQTIFLPQEEIQALWVDLCPFSTRL